MPEPVKLATGGAYTVSGLMIVSVHAFCVVTINITEYVPAVLYMVDDEVPAPMAGLPPGIDQLQPVIGSPAGEFDASVSDEGEFRQTLVLLNPATGSALIFTGSVTMFWQPGLALEVTVSVTEYVPGFKNTCVGDCILELFDPDAGSPKIQLQVLMLPVERVDPSVNVVALPKQTGVMEKPAAGSGLTSVTCLIESLHPKAVLTTCVTV